MRKSGAKWDNKFGKQGQSGIINVESRGKWNNKCGKQRESGVINVENRVKVG
jgi:hypothetical protein